MREFLATLVPAIGQALVHFLWQGVAIGAVAALALRLARDARPQVRYAIACAALLACAVVPLVAIAMAFGETAGVAFAGNAGTLRFVDGGSIVSTPLDWQARLDAMLPHIVALWASGASVFCLRTVFGLAWVQRMRALPQPPLQARWQATLDALAARFGLRGVSLRLVEGLESPVAAGWWRPVVLLPMSVALRMPAELVEALLAHELAHVRRHDYLVNLLQRAVEALLFYHPVVWWLSRRVRIERELVADRLAADALGEPRRLALALAALSELPASLPAPPHLAHAAHGGQLMSRIQQLVRPRSRTGLPVGRFALPVLGIAAACIAFYAQAQIGQHQVSSPKATQVARVTDDREAWAFVRKNEDRYSMSGSTRDMTEIEAAKRALQDDFVWFRRDGKAWVVDDPSIVSRARGLWTDLDAVSARLDVLGKQMDVHGKTMEAYGAEMEKLAGGHGPSPAMEEARARIETLAEEQRELASKHRVLAMKQRKADDAEREQLERDMETLGERMEVVGDQMEAQGDILQRESAQLQKNAEPMEALGHKMEAASKPMEALGKQMGELGRQAEQEARKAEKGLQALIAEAMQKGLAKQAPMSR